jgi:hypothetical protein
MSHKRKQMLMDTHDHLSLSVMKHRIFTDNRTAKT